MEQQDTNKYCNVCGRGMALDEDQCVHCFGPSTKRQTLVELQRIASALERIATRLEIGV